MPNLSRDEFIALATQAQAQTRPGSLPESIVIPLAVRVLSDQLTPVLAYRRLVASDRRDAPSFLLESVEGGERQGRYSILGARPQVEFIAREHRITQRRLADDGTPVSETTIETADPLDTLRNLTRAKHLVRPGPRSHKDVLPSCVLGGLFGYASYDTVRYAEPDKLGFATAPRDDRGLPDLHFAYYDSLVIFDHADKIVFIVKLVELDPGSTAAEHGAAFDAARDFLLARLTLIELHSKPLPSGLLHNAPATPRQHPPSNLSRDQHRAMLAKAMEYIRAGDVFQVVLGQRFERRSHADPFDVYRALRAVNPSPYMVYLQAQGCILVASSPEILCRVRRADSGFEVTNRPLAGTRRRGRTPEEDKSLEVELLGDQKERAEHIMLVDLGRNDVGRVAQTGSVRIAATMEVERYSHVMHLSSTIKGALRPGLDCWDALRAALPVGTISGAPKIRAMQIIDELEPLRRGPYGGGIGYVGLDGQMDIALTLRTMVIPTAAHQPGAGEDSPWIYHLQAAGGIVADSDPDDEYMETVNKSAALARAIDVAEEAFGS